MKWNCLKWSLEASPRDHACLISFQRTKNTEASDYNRIKSKRYTRTKWVWRSSPVQWLFDDRLFLKQHSTHRTLLKRVREMGYFLDELNAYSSDCRLPHGILFSGLRVSLSDLPSTRTTTQTLARGLKWGCLMRRLHYAREIWKRRFVLEENSGSEITWLSWRHRSRKSSVFQMFPVLTSVRKASVFKFPRFATRIFEKLHFRGRLEWVLGWP